MRMKEGKAVSDTRSVERRRIDQAELLVREGHAGKVARLLKNQALGRPDTDVVSGLKALHPKGPEFLPAVPQGAPVLQWVDPAELVLSWKDVSCCRTWKKWLDSRSAESNLVRPRLLEGTGAPSFGHHQWSIS